MLYIVYLLIAAAVIWCSVKASEYVDILEKKTSLSGAFIGGVLLSAVTSLPELFTSLSSALLLDKPGLAIGNILGSNLFNYAMLACFAAYFYKRFTSSQHSPSHAAVGVTVAAIYIIMFLNMAGVLKFELAGVNVTSILIIILYGYGVFCLSKENESGETIPFEEKEAGLPLREIQKRLAGVSAGIVVLSVVLTYITDSLAGRLGIGSGLAGALFLGIATSLPEASSTFMLFRLKNYNIAVGNIVGSNLFNFIILAAVDVIYRGKGIYDYSDPKSVNLLIFGAIANLLFLRLIWKKPTRWRIFAPYLIILCYALSLWI